MTYPARKIFCSLRFSISLSIPQVISQKIRDSAVVSLAPCTERECSRHNLHSGKTKPARFLVIIVDMIRSLHARASELRTLVATLVLGIFLFRGATLAQESLSFDEALLLSQTSPAVKLAEVQVISSQKQVAIASSLVSGSLSAGYSLTSGELTAPDLAEPQSLDKSGFDPFRLSANFIVIPYGPRYDSIEHAQARLTQAERDVLATRAEALIAGAEAYLSALRAAQELDLKMLALSKAQAEYSANQQRFEAGALSASQLTQSELVFQQAQLDLSSAELGSQSALLNLSNRLGVQVLAVTEATITLNLSPDYELETQVLARSDVQKAALSLEQTRRDAAATLRDNLPSGTVSLAYAYATDSQNLGLGAAFDTTTFQPSLNASYDFDDEPSGTTPEGSNSNSLSFSVGLSIPLDSSLPDALALADVAVQQAELSFDQTLAAARLNIYNTQEQVLALEASLKLNQDLLAQAEDSLRISEQRFELGLVSQFDVQAAQLNLNEQLLRLARARDSLMLAQLRYLQSLGLNLMEVF